jgi:uncharacterized protein YceH (UPF0502 family)
MNDPRRDLTAEEARVLGCLVEKEATTPDAYPLTVNSLRNACNQSTSRDPVMSLTDRDVERALASLRERGLTRTVHSTSNRATKFRHVLPDVLELDAPETALLAVLMLRGEQTIGELKTRTERQYAFDSVDAVAATLSSLAERSLVRHLERRPGQKDARWVELLSRERDEAHGAAHDERDPANVGASGDPYGEATAEFYDLLATSHWEAFGLQLLDLLDGVDPTVGPLVDVGAGTGVGLPYLRMAVPNVHVHAIEPSRAMRTALHTRLALDAELRSVTTVDPRPFSEADLPERACAVVVSAALGHLTEVERGRLWRFVAERMPPGAPAVVEVLPPTRPIDVPRARYRSVVVGDHTYEGWQQGEIADDRSMAWTMEYRVLRGDTELASSTVRSTWRCFDADDIRSEIEPHGLRLSEHDDCVVIRR